MFKNSPTSRDPIYIVFIIDQSSLMDEIYQNGMSKAEFAANEVNHFINNLIYLCSAIDKIKDWFFITIIGHSNNIAYEIRSDYLSEFGHNPLKIIKRKKKVSDGAGGFFEIEEETAIFIKPKSFGKENLHESFEFAHNLIKVWSNRKKHTSKLIINISGQYNENWLDTTSVINNIKKKSDGFESPIIFNLFISNTNYLEFPSLDKMYDKSFANQLFFEWSSYLNYENIGGVLKNELNINIGSKAFSNKGLLMLNNLINIGS